MTKEPRPGILARDLKEFDRIKSLFADSAFYASKWNLRTKNIPKKLILPNLNPPSGIKKRHFPFCKSSREENKMWPSRLGSIAKL